MKQLFFGVLVFTLEAQAKIDVNKNARDLTETTFQQTIFDEFMRPSFIFSEEDIWDIQGSSIVQEDQTKLLPATFSTQGAIFMKKPIMSDMFEVNTKLSLDWPNINPGPGPQPGIAFWLLTTPTLLPKNFGALYGRNEKYSGQGIFITKVDGKMNLVLRENFGFDPITSKDLDSQRSNQKCQMEVSDEHDLELRIKVKGDNIKVTYKTSVYDEEHHQLGPAEIQNCIFNMKMKNSAVNTYFGITAQNPMRHNDAGFMNVDVKRIKFSNNNPKKYLQEQELEKQNKGRKSANYITDLASSQDTQNDILEEIVLMMEIKEREDARFTAQRSEDSMHQIMEGDSTETSLFKMYEHVKHVNWSLSHLLEREDGLHKLLKQSEELPNLIRGFEKIPDRLREEEQMLGTMTYQITDFSNRISSMIDDALVLRHEALSAIPPPAGIKLQLDSKIINGVYDLQQELTMAADKYKAIQTSLRMKGDKMVEDILNFAQSDTGKKMLEPVPQLSVADEFKGYSSDNTAAIETRFYQQKARFIEEARENSQWLNIVEAIMVIMAAIGVILVWLKINKVSQKWMLN